MPKRWEDAWVRVRDTPPGGQGVSFIVMPIDSDAPLAFIKTLSRQRDVTTPSPRLTGHEPRVLKDEAERPPHQRLEERIALADLLDHRQFIRVMSALDRAVAIDLLPRYATAPELISALETAMRGQSCTRWRSSRPTRSRR